ncbi:MAG: SUKH-4 family immunity protein [Prevotella sp.]|jgi:hypothetical protein|nr:SUKH-4 family immunity protein [Prevotella sp.]
MDISALLTNVLSSLDVQFIGIKFKSNIIEKEFHDDKFYIIGNDYEDEIGVKKEDFSVYSLSKQNYIFMNSSFKQLIECIKTFTNILDFDEDYDDDIRQEEIKEIVEKFNTIDNQCLKNGAWWTYIIEQSQEGIL